MPSNLSILGVDWDPSEFLSREIIIKLCKIYSKIKFCIKIVSLNGSYSGNTQPIGKQRYPRGSLET